MYPFINHIQNDVISKMFWKNLHTLFYTLSVLDKKAEKMKSELSRVLRDAGYANAAEFFTELFAVREEKRKYEEACKEWQQECVRAEISIAREAFCNEETARRSEKRHC